MALPNNKIPYAGYPMELMNKFYNIFYKNNNDKNIE